MEKGDAVVCTKRRVIYVILGRGSHRDLCRMTLRQVLIIFTQGEAVIVKPTDCRPAWDLDIYAPLQFCSPDRGVKIPSATSWIRRI